MNSTRLETQTVAPTLALPENHHSKRSDDIIPKTPPLHGAAAQHKELYESSGLGTHYSSGQQKVRLWGIERDYAERFFTDKTEKLLEGGCGSGRIALALESMGHTNVTAFDFSKTLVDDALIQAKNLNSKVRFMEADACNLTEFADHSFSYAFYGAQLFSLIPMPGRISALCEARRVLKPGGVMVFSALNRMASMQRRALLKLFSLKNFLTTESYSSTDMPYLTLGQVTNWKALFKPTATVTWFSPREIASLVESAGFEVLHTSDTENFSSGKKCGVMFMACRRRR